jgi:hypothetical protein
MVKYKKTQNIEYITKYLEKFSSLVHQCPLLQDFPTWLCHFQSKYNRNCFIGNDLRQQGKLLHYKDYLFPLPQVVEN